MSGVADVFSNRKRSEIMSRVRSTGNRATELALMILLRRHRISGWRRGARLFGNPDFVFPKQHLAIFVDGCFWHGCPTHATHPASNKKFWETKLTRNKSRDLLVVRTLKQRDWRILRIWQHELSRQNEKRLVAKIHRAVGLN